MKKIIISLCILIMASVLVANSNFSSKGGDVTTATVFNLDE